jgi:predicted transcriptional regulator
MKGEIWMKKYTFHDHKGKVLNIKPTEIACLAGEDDADGERMYFIFIRDFEEQKLSAPYAQIRTIGKDKIATQIWFQYDVAEKIFDFFAAVDQGELHQQKKKYTFTTPKGIKISFKPNLIFELKSEGRGIFTFTLAYVKNFKKQKLSRPYVQLTESGKTLATEAYFSPKEAKKILDFFTKAHMLGPSALVQGLSLGLNS